VAAGRGRRHVGWELAVGGNPILDQSTVTED
jgi:hypothetical protein